MRSGAWALRGLLRKKSAAAPSVTLPSDVAEAANLQIYLDPALGVTQAGGTVSSWVDQSSNAYDFSQGTGTKEPAFVSGAHGGNDGIQGDGVDDVLSRGALTIWSEAGNGASFFGRITAPTSLGASNFIFAVSGSAYVLNISSAGAVVVDGTTISTNGAVSDGTLHSIVYSRTAAGVFTCLVDDVDVTAAGPPTNNTRLQARYTHSRNAVYNDSIIGRVCCFDTDVSADTKTALGHSGWLTDGE